ncbi:MFS transporter [Streptomyces sp. NPDC101132]|uniref:MFS transporter n=1 Tax=Streptomyces sp. NPDC101132 TaxID=3366110 RepID=UPI003821A604
MTLPKTALWGLLGVLAGNMLIDALEVSTAVVAAPAIGADLGIPDSGLHWVLSAFALGFGGLLLFGTRITGRYGRRPVYLAALLGFAAASVAGALTDEPGVLFGTRLVKGMCAALTAPTGLAIIATAFPEGRPRERALSVYTLFGAAGFTGGLLLSGALTEAGWRLTFAFPAPVVLVLFVLGLRLIPADGTPRVAAGGPLVPGVLLRTPALVRSALGAAALNGSYLGLLFLLTLRLQHGAGWGPLATGLAFLPASVPLMLTALHSGRLVSRFGAARLIALGAVAPPAGYLLALGVGTPVRYASQVLPVMLLVGAGFVLSFTALHTQATAAVPAELRGTAGSLYQTAVQTGAALTLTAVASLSAAGYRTALLLVTGVGLAGLCVALAGVLPGRRAPAPEPAVPRTSPTPRKESRVH